MSARPWETELALATRQADTAWYAALLHIGLIVVVALLAIGAGVLSVGGGLYTVLFCGVAGSQAFDVAKFRVRGAILLFVNGIIWTAVYGAIGRSPFLFIIGIVLTLCYARGVLGTRRYQRIVAARAAVGQTVWSV